MLPYPKQRPTNTGRRGFLSTLALGLLAVLLGRKPAASEPKAKPSEHPARHFTRGDDLAG